VSAVTVFFRDRRKALNGSNGVASKCLTFDEAFL
jgi:hypothetical protein